MNYQDDAIRALIRAAGWHAMRHAPWWVPFAILALSILAGNHR